MKFDIRISVAAVHMNMGMQTSNNSVSLLQYGCKIFSLSKDLRKSHPGMSALNASKSLDSPNTPDKTNRMNLQAERQKDSNIPLVLT